MRKKSQTATEFLVILAVVIVIALIVVGILGGIPGVGTGVSESATRVALSSAKIGINNYAIDDTGSSLQLLNNNPDNIRINSINIGFERCQMCNGDFLLRPGERTVFECNNVQIWEPNERYQFPIVVNYTDVETGATYIQEESDLQIIGRSGNLRQSLADDFVPLIITDASVDTRKDGYTDSCNNMYIVDTQGNGPIEKRLLNQSIWNTSSNYKVNDIVLDSKLNIYAINDTHIFKISSTGAFIGSIATPSTENAAYTQITISEKDELVVAYPFDDGNNNMVIGFYDSNLNFIRNASTIIDTSSISWLRINYFDRYQDKYHVQMRTRSPSTQDNIFIFDENANIQIQKIDLINSPVTTTPLGVLGYVLDNFWLISYSGDVSSVLSLDVSTFFGAVTGLYMDSSKNLYISGRSIFSSAGAVKRFLANGSYDSDFDYRFDVDQENYYSWTTQKDNVVYAVGYHNED